MASKKKRVVQLNEQIDSNNAAKEVDEDSGDESDIEDDDDSDVQVNEVRHFCFKKLI